MSARTNAIEFQAVAHDGALDIPPPHRGRPDGKTVRVIPVDAEAPGADARQTPFARLRRVRIRGPQDFSADRDAYVLGERDA